MDRNAHATPLQALALVAGIVLFSYAASFVMPSNPRTVGPPQPTAGELAAREILSR